MMSTVAPLKAEKPVATRAGADLREARERLGWSLADVAETLRIRLVHLQALEDGRIGSLPGNAYALAFVRNYAVMLGLDPEEMVRRFKAEADAVNQPPELVFPVPMPERGLPTGALMLLGVLLMIGAYVGWYRLSGEGRLPAEAVMSVPERLAPLTQQATPPGQVGATQLAPADQADAGVTQAAQPTAAVAGAAAAPVAMSVSPASAAAAQLPAIPAADATKASGLTSAVPDGTRVVVRATADAWLQVKDKDGNVLLNKVLRAGDSWLVPARNDLSVTTGNAGGTDILVDGKPIPSLGVPGAVRHDLSLDPDQLKTLAPMTGAPAAVVPVAVVPVAVVPAPVVPAPAVPVAAVPVAAVPVAAVPVAAVPVAAAPRAVSSPPQLAVTPTRQ